MQGIKAVSNREEEILKISSSRTWIQLLNINGLLTFKMSNHHNGPPSKDGGLVFLYLLHTVFAQIKKPLREIRWGFKVFENNFYRSNVNEPCCETVFICPGLSISGVSTCT